MLNFKVETARIREIRRQGADINLANKALVL